MMWGVFIFTYQYAVIGGDMRQVLLLQSFAGKHSCIRFGVGEVCENAEEATSIEQAVSKAKNLLLPIPMCKGDKLNIQQGEVITKEQLLEYVRAGQSIFAGCIDAEWKRKALEKGVVCYDYMEENTIAIYNSVATAEGTLAEIIRTYPQNLHGTKVLVLGFGKCARTLAAKLKALDAKVSVAARSENALMEAYVGGYHTVKLDALPGVMGEYSVIVNTIPARILTKQELPHLKKEAIVYEIASMPYGVDVEAAKELGITVYICSALPAKYAPVSSAEILKQYIIEKQGGNT